MHGRPAAQPQRHVREVGAQGGGIAPIAEQLPQPELLVVIEAALGAAVEQRDQVEAGVADPRALAVDDAGDAIALGQHVQVVEVEVRDAGDRQGGGIGGLPDRDHAVEQGRAGRRVPPQRSVQAVAVGAADERPAKERAPRITVAPLLLLKPDAVQRRLIGTLIERFERKGLRLAGLKFLQADRALAEKHYAVHKGKPFYESLLTFLTSGPTVALVWEGREAVAVGRNLMGVTDGAKAIPGTVRGDYAISVQNNLVHGSDSPENAAIEVALWFKKEELVGWTTTDANWVG